jgi:hypothetical protein
VPSREHRTFQFRELRLEAFPIGRVAAESGVSGRPGRVEANFAAFTEECDLARNAVARPSLDHEFTAAAAAPYRCAWYTPT